MSLYIYVIDPELRQKFRQHLSNRRWTDSGFDLLCPQLSINFPEGDENYGIELKLGVKCAALTESGEPAPYLLLARSSTSLTPLRMSNQIGLADMGYRGELIARVDYVGYVDDIEQYNIEEGRRLFQIVQHNWMPWTDICIVDTEQDLPPPPDNRGAGGFGSTGQ
jgi:dUTPase